MKYLLFISIFISSFALAAPPDHVRITASGGQITCNTATQWGNTGNFSVTNNCSKDVLIPLLTNAEWLSFKNNPPACISVTTGCVF